MAEKSEAKKMSKAAIKAFATRIEELMEDASDEDGVTEAMRQAGVVPPCTLADTLTGGITHDIDHLRSKGGHNKVAGATNLVVKGGALYLGGKLVYDLLTKE